METLVVGRITTVFGVRGWVKVHSFTEQVETLCSFQAWWVETAVWLESRLIDDSGAGTARAWWRISSV